MKYQVIIEIYEGQTQKTEWIVGGEFYQKQLAELFARSYEQLNRVAGLEAIVVDLDKKESFGYADTDNVKYADTDSIKIKTKSKLNSIYGRYDI